MCGFTGQLRSRIDALTRDGLLAIKRACYLVQHGVWSHHELEGLILGCPYPDFVLNGDIQPESRHLYAFVQGHARTALLGGVLDRAISSSRCSRADGQGHNPSGERGARRR